MHYFYTQINTVNTDEIIYSTKRTRNRQVTNGYSCKSGHYNNEGC